MILLASPHIVDYQVVQECCGQLRIHLTIAPEAQFSSVAQAVQKSVAVTVAQYDCLPATVAIEQGVVPLVPGVKRRRVQRVGQ